MKGPSVQFYEISNMVDSLSLKEIHLLQETLNSRERVLFEKEKLVYMEKRIGRISSSVFSDELKSFDARDCSFLYSW